MGNIFEGTGELKFSSGNKLIMRENISMEVCLVTFMKILSTVSIVTITE